MVKRPCTHHWLIEVSNGPVSRGECQLCHEVRDFANSSERTSWVDRSKAKRGEQQ